MESLVRGASNLLISGAVLLCCQCIGSVKNSAAPSSLINAATVRISLNGPVTLVNGKPAEGVLYQLDEHRDTTYAVPFHNGREDGWIRSYYPNGQIKERRYYQQGWKEGEHTGWYPDGRIAYIYHFRSDMYDGTVREWSPVGVLFRDMNYQKGMEVGRQVIRYADGKIKSNYIIKNGVRYGLLGTKNCVNVSDSVAMPH